MDPRRRLLAAAPAAAQDDTDDAVTRMLDLGAAFAFSNLGGKNATADDRFGKVYARTRF